VVADGNDAVIEYGGRRTYFPPFVHQEPSQCTMTAALMAANVAYLGALPPTADEVRSLALASGEPAIPDKGYTTRHMMAALGRRYDLDVQNVALGLPQWRNRLARGWVGCLAVEYPLMPDAFRLDKDFTGGHRLVIVGYDEATDSTRLLDPIAQGARHRGVDIPVEELYPAMGHFSGWQVWLREGQAVRTTVRIERVFEPPATVTLKGNGTRKFRFLEKARPGFPVVRTPDADVTLQVDARGRFRRAGQDLDPGGPPLLRVAGGERAGLVGLWLEATDGVKLDGEAPEAAIAGEGTFAEGYLAGIADERERWEAWLARTPADEGPGPLTEEAPDLGVGKGLLEPR
jgi:hypothetical protein